MSHFLDLIRDHRGVQADLIARLGALAADPEAAGTSPGTMIRHLDALAFRLDGGGAPDLADLRCVFIRAPQLGELGPDVEVLLRVDGGPVLVREGNVLATTFHPELTDDPRIHSLLLR